MLAIIPARGGSKGVPGKNIKPLCGKPLIVYTIEAAKAAKAIDHIILSTDDEEIAGLARSYGVDIPFMRPQQLAQDDSLAIDTYIYTIDRLNKEFNNDYNEFVMLQPTSPLRTAEDIDKAVALFHQKKADSVISCVAMNHPLEWVCAMNEEGRINRIKEDEFKVMKNRQDLKQHYIPNGAIIVFNYPFLKREYTYYSDKTYGYVMPTERSIDIDTTLDFKFAEFLMAKEGKHEGL